MCQNALTTLSFASKRINWALFHVFHIVLVDHTASPQQKLYYYSTSMKRRCTFFFQSMVEYLQLLHLEINCTYVLFVILWQNTLKKIFSSFPPSMGSKFLKNDQNCLLGSYSCQWHHFEPNPSTQFSSTVFCVFLKIEKMQLMRFAVHSSNITLFPIYESILLAIKWKSGLKYMRKLYYL